MAKSRILIVEDDRKTAATLALYLDHAGLEAVSVHDGRSGLDAALSGEFALVLLDLMLPGLDGREVCRRIREVSDLPVIMLTARTTEGDRIDGLDSGADDYVSKPFSPREVMARVRAVLRRRQTPETGGEILDFEGLTLDPAAHEARVDGAPIALTPTEFRILLTLAASPGRVFSRDEIVERALGLDFDGYDRTVDAHIMNLRKKIEPDRTRPRYIVTVFGAGYRFGRKPA